VHLHDKSSEVCIKTKLTPASLPFKGQVTRQTTVKWSIAPIQLFLNCSPDMKERKISISNDYFAK